MSVRIFVINPGSTSTKLALFEDERRILTENVFHDSSQLLQFRRINDQLPYRMKIIRDFIRNNHLDLSQVDAFIGRGGSCYPVPSGVYEITPQLLEDTRAARGGLNHVSNLGVQLAAELQREYGGRMFMMDPTVVDEYQDIARITGIRGIHRRAISHVLNQKETARRHAEAMGCRYEDLRLIICHIDGGISISAHDHGRMIDGNNAAGGEGPFTPTRIGGLAITDLIEHLSGVSPEKLLQMCTESGGFTSHFGTSSADTVHRRIEEGDAYARLVWDAMIYQTAKEIGAMSVVLRGRVDAILLTGGLLRFPEIEASLREQCGFIAPVYAYPGEYEMDALARGARDVLTGRIQPSIYPGRPVWEGFPFPEE